jgi:hypothetical protein
MYLYIMSIYILHYVISCKHKHELGLINKGQLTSRLTTEELRMVIPTKPINAVTLRMSEVFIHSDDIM